MSPVMTLSMLLIFGVLCCAGSCMKSWGIYQLSPNLTSYNIVLAKLIRMD